MSQTIYRRTVEAVRALLSVALPLLAFAFILGLQRRIGLAIYDEQFLAAILAIALALAFLAHPFRRAKGEGAALPAWHDLVLAALGFAAPAYVAVRYSWLVDEAAFDPSVALIPGALVIVLLLEALRRTAGPVLTGITAVFVAYGLWGNLVPTPLQGRAIAPERLVSQVALDPNGILGTPLMISATVVVAFVFFGLILTHAGGSTYFTNLSVALMGRFRGGSSKIAIVASGLMGSISGSAVSNVVSTGVVTIPLMTRGGYRSRTAGAIEAVASTGGQLMPPIMGAAAFLMAEFLQVPYGEVVLAALLPAVLYYAALFIQADLFAARHGIRALPAAEIPAAGPTFRSGWFFPIPFAVLLGGLFLLHIQVEEAALWSTAALVLLAFGIGFAGRRMAPSALLKGLRETGLVSLSVVLISAAAGIIIGVLNQSGLSFNLTLLLTQLGQTSVILLLLIAALVSIVLGMGMPTVGVYVLLATLVAPALVELGIEPIAAHLFVLYFGMMSMITPPVAIAAFAAAGLAGSNPMQTALEATRLAWPAFIVPFLFVAAPSLLLIGSVWQVALAIVTALAGVWLVSAGMMGHFVDRLSAFERVGFLAAGVCLLIPATAFDGAAVLEIAGAALAAGLTAWKLRRGPRHAPISDGNA
ncbi:TRAP transporter permease [Amorphus orientalis]|uniref:TRAP transporter 4TM/12TM fusion protein n=1 Tax=Amorphus orientalis TaxID=649198 RepID=A0AAE3VQA0_9HYPH|nr:TRAP transporter fused permease subunit [Amorphus orientalis]MDQ0316352.1 TRAP transporter 4TM/12TM fusion protein [Amorphus orientalis]